MKHTFKGYKLKSLPEEAQEALMLDLLALGAKRAAEMHFENLGFSEANLYQVLLREHKKLGIKAPADPAKSVKSQDNKPKRELTEEEKQTLEDYKSGKIGYDEMHRILSSRAMEQILRGEADIKLSDWLRSEQIKIKKDQSEEQKDAMAQFIDSFFSGFAPSPVCPHCGESTLVERELLSERKRVSSTKREVSTK